MNKNKINWYDITLLQFKKIQEAITVEDEQEKIIALMQAVFGDSIIDLPITEFNAKVKELDFLKAPIPDSVPPKKLEINGRKYYTDCLLGNITTAQYVDYVNHSKTGDLEKILSVFIIPDGHKYNDGYDMLQVMNDINDLSIVAANNISFFFVRQFHKFTQIFLSYSTKKIKKMKLPKETKKKLIETITTSMDLALSPLYLDSVK